MPKEADDIVASPVYMNLQLPLLVKLGSIAIHAEEFTSPDGHEYDRVALHQLLADPEVKAWLKRMDDMSFLPKKRW